MGVRAISRNVILSATVALGTQNLELHFTLYVDICGLSVWNFLSIPFYNKGR